MKFTYESKGTIDDWSTDKIEAEDQEAAQLKLDEIYGIERDPKTGKQTNSDMVKVRIISPEK